MRQFLNVHRSARFASVLAVTAMLTVAAGRAAATEYIYTTIDYPGAQGTEVSGINDSGQVVGAYLDEDDVYHSFILGGGVYTSFDPPDAIQTGSLATDINNLGQIAGYYDAGWRLRGYLRTQDTYSNIVYPGDPGTLVTGINDLGQAVGYLYPSGGTWRGFYFDGANYTIVTDTNAVSTYAWGINNAGVIVGSGWDSSGLPHAFIRELDGTYTDFQLSSWPADATGINDSGQIVGRYGPTPDDHYGFVLSGGVGSTPDMLQVLGASITEGWDINNLGQVVGRYTNGTFANGPWHGFLATPIPDIPGDYDCNGVVDAADYVVWRDTRGSTFDMRANGDNYDASAHLIDAADYDMWRTHFGETAGEAAGASLSQESIPEPASLLLAAIGALAMLCIRHNV